MGAGVDMFRRAGTLLFGLMAAVLGTAALVDVHLHGQLTLIDPRLLGGLAVIGTGFLLFGIVSSRDRATDLEGRTDRLTALTGELETFIGALEAANQRLNASEARYKGLVDSQGDAILRRTPDGRLTYANESFFRLFGVKPLEVIGQSFRPEPHPQSPAPVFGRFAARESGRERVSYDQHVRTITGYRWLAWEDYAIRDTDGRLIEIQSVGRDITERKELEAALTEARDKAQGANRAKSQFLATMSHEIRTPMNGVLGMARLLLETQLMPDQKTYAEAIAQSGLSLLALIEDLLDFSKIEAGSMALGREPVPLRPLIESITELLAPRAQAKNIELTAAIAADVPETVETDPVRLRQILTNLVGNAVKFTEEGGVLVCIAIEQTANGEQMLRLSVRDTGIGVPVEKRAEIFEEFVQADSSHARRFGGTGLGLAISKRLVKAMGGTIGITSAEDRGSIFWVGLPLASLSPSLPPSAVTIQRTLKKKRVAVISNSKLLRSGLKLQIAAAGAETVELPDIQSMTREQRDIDIAVLDAGVSGTGALPNVSVLGIPVVALLPPQQRAELALLAAKGFHGYLMKPVRQTSLEQRLAATLSGEKLAPPPSRVAPPPETSISRSLLNPILDKVPPFSTPAQAAPAPTPAPATAPQAAAPRATGTSFVILLAEDNPVNALLARELLRRRGHSVKEVTTGDAAVSAHAAGVFDLIVMDVHMPGMDGIEATKWIRAAEAQNHRPRKPILALTADALDAGRKACMDAGMDGVLTKPLDPDQLDRELAALTQARVAAE